MRACVRVRVRVRVRVCVCVCVCVQSICVPGEFPALPSPEVTDPVGENFFYEKDTGRTWAWWSTRVIPAAAAAGLWEAETREDLGSRTASATQ